MWQKVTLEQYIRDQIQEGPHLEYKAADALGRTDGKMKEISKDVSAMANSSGGVIIYGIREFDVEDKKHLPERFDPVNQTEFSREWLEQVINNIRPKIPDLKIHSIDLELANNRVAYVIEIPQSTTAHQATDFRYYKRFNFLATPMEDYEVRDVMNRHIMANASLTFGLYHGAIGDEPGLQYRGLRIILKNEGERVINRVKVVMKLSNIGYHDEGDFHNEMVEHYSEVDGALRYLEHGLADGSIELTIVYQPNEVLFPKEEIDVGAKIKWGYPDEGLRMMQFDQEYDWQEEARSQNWKITWKLFADNMPSKEEVANVWELPTMQ